MVIWVPGLGKSKSQVFRKIAVESTAGYKAGSDTSLPTCFSPLSLTPQNTHGLCKESTNLRNVKGMKEGKRREASFSF